VEGADPHYRELRVQNELTNGQGDAVQLKVGAHVVVTVEADADDTIPKKMTVEHNCWSGTIIVTRFATVS
jgi:hypothetical protein